MTQAREGKQCEHGRVLSEGCEHGCNTRYKARLLREAAPDLLEAARLAKEELRTVQGPFDSPALVAVRQAIAKAEGRE
jgi:hypothetical protein